MIESDDYVSPAEFLRAASEEAADAVIAKGGRVMVMRLSQVHDTRHQGRIAQHIFAAMPSIGTVRRFHTA